jgi:hypothetical protein
MYENVNDQMINQILDNKTFTYTLEIRQYHFL